MRSFAAGFVSALLLVAAVGVLASAKAQEMWAVLNGIAIHLDGRDHCNSITKGLGVERGDYSAGFYLNSNCRWSTYAAKAWMPLQVFEGWRAGLIGGVVTGYRTSPMPVAAFGATYERQDWGLNIVGVPPLKETAGGVLWFQLKKRFR